jgi:uncharacterized protein (DUF427 family)
VRGTWNGEAIAASDDTVAVEGSHRIPAASVRTDLFATSEKTSDCPWKRRAGSHSLRVGGDVDRDAAWYHPEPRRRAAQITNAVAFWRGVAVEA